MAGTLTYWAYLSNKPEIEVVPASCGRSEVLGVHSRSVGGVCL
jgi:hypothetical protein